MTETGENHGTELQGRWLILARAVWLILSLASLIILFIGTNNQLHVSLLACTPPHANCGPWAISQEDVQLGVQLGFREQALFLLATVGIWFPRVVMIVIAIIIFWRKSSDWMALLLSLMIMVGSLEGIKEVGVLLSLQSGLYSIAVILFVVIPFVFPNGRFVPRWTAWISIPLALGMVVATLVPQLIGAISIAWFPLAAYAAIYRYRRISNAIERQQTKWVVVGLLSTSVSFIPMVIISRFFPPWQPTPERLAFMFLVFNPIYVGTYIFFSVSVAIAIFRYRLWDIDLIINRTLVYSALTAITVGIYALLVGGLGYLFQSNNYFFSLLVTGLIAVIFQPLRERLQRGVNRLLYGERDDPISVLTKLGQRLEAAVAPEVILPSIAESIAQALRLPYVAILLKEGTEFLLAADYGQKPASSLTCDLFPLSYQTEPIGQILVARRAGEDAFGVDEKALLQNIARQVGVAAYAVQLTRDLQRSRERLVTAREEERRRLRRDLHDGLGPTLATLTLKLDAARNQLKHNPEQVDTLLVELKAQTQAAIADIRRLVYDLRPPALDELGLFSAIQEYASN
ncbi:MAG TPA: histidine kinase, partial [Anaerolineales bacterium]|nr:histidine kinase [Anaerolineales bacterium]